MPLTPELRSKIDRIRDYLFAAGHPDPMRNAEQLSYLFFFNMMEAVDSDNRLRASDQSKFKSIFDGQWKIKNPLNAPENATDIPREHFRWSFWVQAYSGERLQTFVRDEVIAFFQEVTAKSNSNFLRDARLGIDDPVVLNQVLALVDELELTKSDADTKGDLFEYVLKQIGQAGELGQFRTPRHIIRLITELVDPRIGETICDPAVGTAGFLVAAYDHIRLQHSSEAAISEVDIDGKSIKRGLGDKLNRKENNLLRRSSFYGNDVDPTMVRLGSMNLFLRGLPDVAILRRNGLTTTLDRATRADLGLPPEGFDVILANPPFSGRVDAERIVDDVKVGNTRQTEILFLKHMLNILKPGGRCGVVVPEGVLFGGTGAHKNIRRQLIENNTVHAVLSLPGGVFQPYAGVKTSILVFAKGGTTDRVMFLHADNDGYRLDANHDVPIADDDLPSLAVSYKARDDAWKDWKNRDEDAEWTEKWWFASVEEIRGKDFDLSAGKYRPQTVSKVEHRDPLELLDELKTIESGILGEIDTLRAKIRDVIDG